MTVTTDEIIDVGQKHLNNIALRAYSDQKEISVYEESERGIWGECLQHGSNQLIY